MAHTEAIPGLGAYENSVEAMQSISFIVLLAIPILIPVFAISGPQEATTWSAGGGGEHH